VYWATANFRTFTSSTGITRGQEDSGAVRHGFADEEIFLCTGKKNTPAYTLPKLLWIKHNHPDIWERAYKFLMSMDYLTAKLTGQCVTDCSKASGTLFYNIKNSCWSKRYRKHIPCYLSVMDMRPSCSYPYYIKFRTK